MSDGSLDAQDGPRDVGFQERDRIARHRSVVVGEQDRPSHPVRGRGQVQPAMGQHVGEHAETRAGVVVAGDRDDLGAGLPDRCDGTGRDPHRLRRGDRPVIDVAGDEDDVDLLLRHHLASAAKTAR